MLSKPHPLSRRDALKLLALPPLLYAYETASRVLSVPADANAERPGVIVIVLDTLSALVIHVKQPRILNDLPVARTYIMLIIPLQISHLPAQPRS